MLTLKKPNANTVEDSSSYLFANPEIEIGIAD